MWSEIPRTLADKVHPRRAGLIVVDVQNDFCADGGYLSRLGHSLAAIQEMVPRLERFIAEARKVDLPIVFVQMSVDPAWHSSPVWLENKVRNVEAVSHDYCVPGTWGVDFYKVQPLSGDIVVRKPRFSAFVGSDLDSVLRAGRIDTAIIAGVTSQVCVESTARDAYQRDYYVVLLGDCTATTQDLWHQRTLQFVERHLGVVASSTDVVAAWEGSGAPVG